MALEMKSNLDASGHNVFAGLTQEVEVVDDMPFELLANSILLESYSKIAYNPNNYNEEEQKILDMLSERSFTFVIKSYQPINNVPFVPDDNGGIVGIEDYVSKQEVLRNKFYIFTPADLQLLEDRGFLTDIKVINEIKYYKRSQIQKLIITRPDDGVWSHYCGIPSFKEDYDSLFGGISDEFNSENCEDFSSNESSTWGIPVDEFDFDTGSPREIHIHLHF